MRSFMELSSLASNIPESHLMDYLELCHHHLRKPVQETLAKGKEGAMWITLSLTGVAVMSSGKIATEGNLAKRFVACWPEILKWAKAIVLKYPFFELFDTFCSVIGPIINMVLLVSESVLSSRDVYDLAVDLWNGKEGSGVNYHTELPLFLCLSSDSNWHVNHLLRRTGYPPMQLVEKIVDRMGRVMNPTEPEKIMASVGLLGKFIESKPHPIAMAVLCSEAPSTISSNLTRLLVDKEIFPFIKMRFFFTGIPQRVHSKNAPTTSRRLLQYGFLFNILETASVRPVEDSKEISTSCLENLLPNLAYNHVLSSVVDGSSTSSSNKISP